MLYAVAVVHWRAGIHADLEGLVYGHECFVGFIECFA